jgi:hypothetical protein
MNGKTNVSTVKSYLALLLNLSKWINFKTFRIYFLSKSGLKLNYAGFHLTWHNQLGRSKDNLSDRKKHGLTFFLKK